MRKLFFLLPLAASALFLTGCDEGSYRERTVVRGGPSYYGGYDRGYGDDFYYVSSRPYSRSYGQLYLRGGQYYYNRGGSYVVYNQSSRYRQSENRYVTRNTRNVSNVTKVRNVRDRDSRVDYRRDDRRERIEDIRDRRDDRVDRIRTQQRTQQYQRPAQIQQTRLDVRGPRADVRGQTVVNRNVRSNREVQVTERRSEGRGDDRRKKKDRDERED